MVIRAAPGSAGHAPACTPSHLREAPCAPRSIARARRSCGFPSFTSVHVVMTKSCAARWPSLASAGGQFAASLRAAVPIDVAYGGGQQIELRLPILAVAVEPD